MPDQSLLPTAPMLDETPPEGADQDSTATFVNKLIRQHRDPVRFWQQQAREADKFIMARVWSKEDEANMDEDNAARPEINFAGKYIDVVKGTLIVNPIEVRFLPRVIDKDEASQLAEEASGVYDATVQACNGSFERTRAWGQSLVRGMGWVGQRLDMDLEPGGRIILEETDGYEMVWDTDARKENLEDAKFVIRLKQVPKKEAIRLWPDQEDYIESSSHDGTLALMDEPLELRKVTPIQYDPLNADDKTKNARRKNWVTVKEAHWYEVERQHEVIDPFTQKRTVLQAKEYKEFKKNFEEIYPDAEVVSAEITQRVYKRAFVINQKTMEKSDNPMQTGLPYKAITGVWDADKKVWRGLLYALMEPSRYASKFMSLTLTMISSSPKGALFFEDGVFENFVEAMKEWNRPDPAIRVRKGMMAGYKIEPPQPLPPGIIDMWQACMGLIQQVTGINIDMLGSSTGEVPGVTTKKRALQGMLTVAHFFNMFRRYIMYEAPGVLEYIRKFYTDQRIIRIGGPFDSQAIKLIRERYAVPWDLIVDDANDTPDRQQQYWEVMGPLIAQLAKLPGFLTAVPFVFDYAPVPPRFKAAAKKYLGETYPKLLEQQAQAAQQAEQQKHAGKGTDPQLVQANVAKKGAEIEKLKAQARAIDQEAGLKRLQAHQSALAEALTHRRAESEHEAGLLERGTRLHREGQRHQLTQLATTVKMLGQGSSGSGRVGA